MDEDEQQVAATFNTYELGQLGYEYASRMAFGAAALTIPKTFAEAKAQMRQHELDANLSLLERQRLREQDIFEAERAVFGEGNTSGDANASVQDEEEEKVDKKDKKKTQWVCIFNARKCND